MTIGEGAMTPAARFLIINSGLTPAAADPPAKPEHAANLDQARAVLARLSAAELERVRPDCSPSAVRWRRLEERNTAIRILAAASRYDDCDSNRALAGAIHRDLGRYAVSAWRFERGRPAPADPVRALEHRILTANSGKPPNLTMIRRALAGTGVAQNQLRI